MTDFYDAEKWEMGEDPRRPLPEYARVAVVGGWELPKNYCNLQLKDAYNHGWNTCLADVEDTACPFDDIKHQELSKQWHQGYREAAQELAVRQEAAISTS